MSNQETLSHSDVERHAGTHALGLGWLDAFCLRQLAEAFRGARIRLRLWDGTTRAMSRDPPVATIVIADRATLVRLLANPALAFGEGYAAGRIEIEGDLVALLDAVARALAGRAFQRAPRAGHASRASARANVHAHYDLGNDFYARWLDARMVYTCAYFETPDATLEDAQLAKLDHVCRKLRLRPGDRVIEAGCGWGALAIHMARTYGASVRAYNISAPQLEYARARAAREGVADRVTFIDADYRAIDGACDAFVSIGMLEHVGRVHYAELGRVIDRVLDREHGRGLLHFIGRNRPMEFNAWIARHIFPGAHAPTLTEILPDVLERSNLSVVDVENLRPHYALTLRHWRARFERCTEDVARQFDQRFVRTWRLYLAGAEAGFTSGDLQLFQVVFGRATDDSAPLTRRALYEPHT